MSERMPVPLMDLAAQHLPLEAELKAAFHDVLHAGQFILGPNVKALEQEIADYIRSGVGTAHLLVLRDTPFD